MKNITKFTCLALGAALVATTSSTFAGNSSGSCCGATTPMADIAKSDAKAKTYPLDTCVVSGEKLGEMGKPYVFTHEGREVKLCCKNCLKDFKKEPAKYLKKLDEAEKADKK
jgi:YHS domain-containing protein